MSAEQRVRMEGVEEVVPAGGEAGAPIRHENRSKIDARDLIET